MNNKRTVLLEIDSALFQITFPDGVSDLARSEIRYSDGSRCRLSKSEAALLRYLAANAGRAVPRDEILLRVWGLAPQRISTRTIDMHVAHLRRKLHDSPQHPQMLVTIRGKGYMLVAKNKAT